MGAPGQTAQNSAAAAIQQNSLLRQALISSAPLMRKNLGSFNTGGTPGGSTRIKLFNVGITTRILLDVQISVDIGTAAATASPKAPFNLINRLKLTDFDGTDRINASGFQLFMLNSVRRRTVYGYNNASQAAVATTPSVPTAVGNAQILRFLIEVPLAYDPHSDLRGALLTQTAVGEAWLSLDWNNQLIANGNADAVYNGAGTSTVVQTNGTLITVNAFQEFYLPQPMANGQVPLPTLDLMTVYEFNGALRSSDNIAAGQEKLFNYPNVRSVIGFYANFLNNGVMNPATTDLSKFRLVANGNNVLREYLPTDKLFEQRLYMADNSDIRAGAYFESHRASPVQTAFYGAVQYGITPGTVNVGNTNFEVGFESFYTKGSTLPGLTQAS